MYIVSDNYQLYNYIPYITISMYTNQYSTAKKEVLRNRDVHNISVNKTKQKMTRFRA